MRNTKSFSIEAINGPDEQANTILKQMYSALLDKKNLSVFEQSILQAIEDAYPPNSKDGKLPELLHYLVKGLKNNPVSTKENEITDLIKNAMVSILNQNENKESLEDKIAEVVYAMSNMDFSQRLIPSDVDNQNERYDFVALCLNAANEEIQSTTIPLELGEVLLNTAESLGVIITDLENNLKFISENLKEDFFKGKKIKVGKNYTELISMDLDKISSHDWKVLEHSGKNKKLEARKLEFRKYNIYQFNFN